MRYKVSLFFSLILNFLLMSIPANAASPAATLTVDGSLVGTYSSVQLAVDEVTLLPGTDFVIEVANGTVDETVDIIQQADKNLTLKPQTDAKVIFTNTITIDGDQRLNGSEYALIQGFSFDMTSPSAPANCIYLNRILSPTYCYAHNIIINGCDFEGIEGTTVALQTTTGGMRDISIVNSTATKMHSLAQLKAISGTAFIQNCTIDLAHAGVNFYGDGDLVVDSCVFKVDEYAVRSGQGLLPPVAGPGMVSINNSILETTSETVGSIVLRGDSTRTVNILHSIITNTSAGGIVLQDIAPVSANEYKILLEETDMNGAIEGIAASGIFNVDDPNVTNGPVCVNQTNTYQVVIIFLIVAMLLLAVVSLISYRRT